MKKNKKPRQYRQGDMLLVEAKESDIWDLKKARKRNVDVLLEGEGTGHAHKLDGDFEILDIERAGRRSESRVETFVRVKSRARLWHDIGNDLDDKPHEAQVIDLGFYRMIRQREFDGTEERFVTD